MLLMKKPRPAIRSVEGPWMPFGYVAAMATWKKVAQRLLDDTCQQRTGRFEEDGC